MPIPKTAILEQSSIVPTQKSTARPMCRAFPANLRRTYGHITVLFASCRLQVLFSLPRTFYESLSGFVLFLLRKSFGGKSKNDFLLYLLITLLVYFSKNPGERKDVEALPYGCAVFGMAIAVRFRLFCKKPQRRRAEVGTPYIFCLTFGVFCCIMDLQT